MSFKFRIPENFSETKTDSLTVYSADKMLVFVRQKTDISSYASLNMNVFLNDVNLKTNIFLSEVNEKIGKNSKYKCLAMAKKLIKDKSSGCEYKTGFSKGLLSFDYKNNDVIFMSLFGIVVSAENEESCIINAFFPCDSETSAKEKLFVDMLESVERIDESGK